MLSSIHQTCLRFSKKTRNVISCLFSIFYFAFVSCAATAQTSPNQNDVPIADAGHSRLIEIGVDVRLDGSGSISKNGEGLNYSWSLTDKPSGSQAVLTGAKGPFPSLTPDLVGDYLVELIVTNSNGLQSEASTTILSTGNLAPVAMSGEDRVVVVGQSIRLDPEGTYDPNGDRLSAAWSIIAFPSETNSDENEATNTFASLEEDEGGRFVFTPSVVGEFSIELKVEDIEGLKSTDIVTVYVLPEAEADVETTRNLPPVANAGVNQVAVVLEEVFLDGTQSTDANGDRLTYEWSILSKPADSFTWIDDSRQAIARLTPDTNRTYVLQLKVTDEGGLADFDTVVISGQGVAPLAVSGGPTTGADGIILDASGQVSAQGSQVALGQSGFLSFNWSALGLSAGQGSVNEPTGLTSEVTFETTPEAGAIIDSDALAGLEIFDRYGLVSFGDLNSNVETVGAALVGGNVVGGRAEFLSLDVVGDIRGGEKTINSGSDVRVGGRVRSRLNFNGEGRLIEDSSLETDGVQQSAISLSQTLSQLLPNSSVGLPKKKNGFAVLTAQPDAGGIAIFDIPNGRDLFQNNRVGQIMLEDNGAASIIVNVGGRNIQFNKGDFTGSVATDNVSSRIIWNFYEANILTTHRDFEGSVLAPFAKFHNQKRVDGAIIAASILERGQVGFPGFSGEGLSSGLPVEETKFSLIQLAVSDSQFPELGSVYASTVLTVGNRRPVAIAASSSGSDRITPGSDVTLNSSASFDQDNDLLSYEWSFLSVPDGSQLELTGSTSSALSLSPDASGLYILQLIVSDGELSSRPATVSFVVENTAPVADAGEDQTVRKRDPVALSGLNSSDFDGDDLAFFWTITEKPAGSLVELVGVDTANPSFETDIGGTYVVTLIVNDGFEDSEPDTVTIVAENQVPVALVSGPGDGNVGDILMLSGVGSSDADGDVLSYSWTLKGPEGSAAQFVDPLIVAPSLVPDLGGIYTLSLVVSDGFAESDPALLVINISAANRPPTLREIEDQTIALGQALSVQLVGTDPDGDDLSYFAVPSPLPAGARLDAQTGVFTYRPQASDVGSLVLNFGVSDGSLTATQLTNFSIVRDPDITTTQLSGRILDNVTNAPVAGAIVMVGDVLVRSNAQGEFFLENLDPNQARIWVNVDSQTSLDVNGNGYGATQTVTSLIADTLNTLPNDIFLSSAGQVNQINNSAPVTIQNASNDIRVTVPEDSIRKGGVTSRHWRIFINEIADDPAAEIGELTLENNTSSGSLFVGGQSSGSSVNSISRISRGFDGNPDLIWTSEDNDPLGPWLAYDLGEDREVLGQKITIALSGRSTSGPRKAPVDFDIQVSTDGENWRTVRNYNTPADWSIGESRSFELFDVYSGPLSVGRTPKSELSGLPVGTEFCNMFTIGPKGISFGEPIEISVNNVEGLPAGAAVDVLVLTGQGLKRRGTATVSADGSEIVATLGSVRGGDIFAFAPRPTNTRVSLDQPMSTYNASLLGEGNYSAAIQLSGYRSNEQTRGLSFVYNSTSASPSPIVSADVAIGQASPEGLSSALEVGGVLFEPNQDELLSEGVLDSGEVYRQSIQFDASQLPPGLNSYKFLSFSQYGCSRVASETEGQVFVDNQSDSPFGRGWSLAELSQIYPQENGTVLLREGNGTLKNFTPQADFSTLGDPVVLPLLGPSEGESFDLDDDGDLDILWIAPEQTGIVVYENAGDRTFINRGVLKAGEFTDVPEQGTFFPDLTSIEVGDVDGDGLTDIATGAQNENGLFVFYGELDGFTFSDAQRVSRLDVRDFGIADFDADGKNEIAIMSGDPDDYLISIALDRSVSSETLDGLRRRFFIEMDIVDFNKDGIPDILGRGRSYIGGWIGQAGGVPTEEFSVFGSFSDRLGNLIEFVDLNNDDVEELIVGKRTPGLEVYERQANGRYQSIETVDVPVSGLDSTPSFAAEDLNGDGRRDIVVATSGSIITYFNLETGLLSEPEVVPVGFRVASPSLGDFNGDGGIDVIVDSSETDQLFVYYSDLTRSEKFIDPLSDYTELTQNDDGSFSRRYNDGTILEYSSEGLQTSVTDSNGNLTAYSYTADGRLSVITDPVGLETNFTYNPEGRLSQISYPDGRTAQWTYNTRGDLIRQVDVNGDITVNDYDENGRMVARTDPRGLTSTIQYDQFGRYSSSTLPDGTELKLELAKTLGLPELGGGEFVPNSMRTTSVTDGRGNVTETVVNDFGSPIKITDPLGRVTLYERDADNNVIAIIAPSSVTPDNVIRTEIDYDARGNVIAKREAVGTSLEREMTYAYEPEFNKMISMVDYDGFETTRSYDAFGNMVLEIDPLGGLIEMSYDNRGLPRTQTDKNGNITTYEYLTGGLVNAIEDASGTRMEMRYDPQGNVTRKIDDASGPLEREMSYTYDEKNRLLTETAADGGVTTYAYDGNDNVISTTDPTGIVETRSYDDRDRLQTINDPASGTTVFTYDEDSNILRMTDALSETTEFTYDAVDRLLSSIDAKGQLRAFAYDSRDNITAVTDARANMTFMGYDALDRPTSRTNSKGEQWNFAYDARDNRVSATKPDGVVLLSDYDALSRLTRIAGGDVERTYAYDAQSNLLAANDNLNGVAGPDLGFTYDGENRLGTASVTNLFGNAAQNNVFTYGYDALDRRATMADSFGGNTAYAYDPVDRLTQVTTPQGETFTTNYDLAGRMLGRAAPNTTATTRTYEDGTGRLASQTQAASDTAFNGFTYDYTDRGNIGEIAEVGTTVRTKRYSYDELERLTEVAVPEAPTEGESYTLDPEGNRLSSHLSDSGETDVANRLTGDDAYSYVYDLNGNLISKTAKPGVTRPDWTYDYDDLDKLISVSRNGVETERYRYDALGRRSAIETANDNSIFERIGIINNASDRTIDLVQGDDGIGGTTPQIQNRYTHGGQVDEPLSLEVFASDGTLDQAYTYHVDHLGSIRFVTDSVGTIVNAYEYDSYGRPGFELETVMQPFRYTGREWDQATGLYHYRERQYDPETGKFLQEDPIGFGGKDFNLSRYVDSNPLNLSDPSGLSALGRTASTGVAAAISAGTTVSRAALSAGGGLLAAEIARESGAISGLAKIGASLACNNFGIAAVLGGGSYADCGMVLSVNGIDERQIIGAGGTAVVAAGGSPGGGENGRKRKCQSLARKIQGTRSQIYSREADLAANAGGLPLTDPNGIFANSVLGHRALLYIQWQNYYKRIKQYDDLNCQDFGPSSP